MSNPLKVVTFTAREQAELIDKTDDQPLGPDEVAGKTLATLVSPGTEINSAYLGEKFPAEPGYAGVFEIDAIGDNVSDLQPGDRVFATGPHGIGGHRSRQRAPQIAALKLPEGLDPATACHARLMGVSMTTLTTTVARPPCKVMITGLGPVGHLAAQMYASCCYQVIAVDPVQQRRETAESKGIRTFAEAPLDDRDWRGQVALVVECSGHEQAALDACHMVRKRGEVVQLGVPWKQRTDKVSGHDILKAVYRGYVTLRSGWEWEIPRHGDDFRLGSVFGNLAAALQWLGEGRVNVEGLYEVADPTRCQQVYQDLMHQKGDALSVVFDWTKV